MRSYSLTFILAGLLALAASFQVPVEIHVVGENVVGGITNAASKAAMAGSSCDYPVYFEIYGFRRWTPRAGNSHSIVVDFGFWDNTTRVATACHLDGSSTDVAAPGLTPRYACEDTKVDFILQSDSLTVVEKVCSGSNLEAAGTVTLNLTCVDTDHNSPYGSGRDCSSENPIVEDPFESLNPTPPKGSGR